MSINHVVLADRSNTIRKIVEWLFTDHNEIELKSFENGEGLQDILVELKPVVVLVDINLPSFDGYSVCGFINNTPSLGHTKVVILKGAFDPVDESRLGELDYHEMITKPFDSSALVKMIEKVIAENRENQLPPLPENTPPAFPEDMPEDIEDMVSGDEINFSDVKKELDEDGVIDAGGFITDFEEGGVEDEVLPSEEVTQKGSSSGNFDSIEEGPQEEDIMNPFVDETEVVPESKSQETIPVFEQETFVTGTPTLEDSGQVDIDSGFEEVPATVTDSETGTFGVQDIQIPQEESVVSEIESVEAEDSVTDSSIDTSESPLEEPVSEEAWPEESPESSDKFSEDQDIPVFSMDDQDSGIEADTFETGSQEANPEEDFEMPSFENIQENVPVEEVVPETEVLPEVEEKIEAPVAMDEGIPEINVEDSLVSEKESSEVAEIEEPVSEAIKVEEELVPEEMPVEEKGVVESVFNKEDKEEIIKRVEEKIAKSVNEVVWEIVPAIAERIIKKEITSIRKEMQDTIDS